MDFKNHLAEKLIGAYGFELNEGSIKSTKHTRDSSNSFWHHGSNGVQQKRADEIWDTLRNRR